MIESKKLLMKLTPKQQELIQVVRDEWTNLTLSRGSSGSRIAQDNEIREGMCYLYKISSKILSKVPEHPRILIFDSYIRMQLGFNLLLRSGENNNQVILENDSMYSARRNGSGLALNDPVCVTMLSRVVGYPLQTSLDNFLYTRVYASLRNCVADPVCNHVRSLVLDPVRNCLNAAYISIHNSFVESYRRASGNLNGPWNYLKIFTNLEFVYDGHIGLAHNGGALSFYDYFSRTGIISNDESKNAFNLIKNMMRAGIWTCCFYKDCALVCRLPTKVSKDELGRLHSTKGPAVQWGDGSRQYFLHGVNFLQSQEEEEIGNVEPELWRKIVSKLMNFEDIAKIRNMEQRNVAFRMYGVINH